MQSSIKNSIKITSQDLENFLTNSVMAPLGSMFSLSLGGKKENHIGKIEENTFEIFSVASSAIVDGDTLINLFLGKTNYSTLKFQ